MLHVLLYVLSSVTDVILCHHCPLQHSECIVINYIISIIIIDTTGAGPPVLSLPVIHMCINWITTMKI